MIGAMPTEHERTTTGVDRASWFGRLDAWGAAGRPYREIAEYLTGEGLSAWWAQKIIVEYEQARGVRREGARRDGTHAAGASKSIGVTVDRVEAAFVDPERRERWLPGVGAEVRATQPGRSVRLDLADGTRLSVQLDARDPHRTIVALEQQRIVDADAVPAAKRAWQERLEALRVVLEES